MAPYDFQPPPGHEGGRTSRSFDSKSYDAARSISGAFSAIGAMYRALANAETVTNPQPDPVQDGDIRSQVGDGQ